MQDLELSKIDGISKEYVKNNLKLVKITSMFFPMMLFLSDISLAIVLYLGGRQTIFKTITTGDFVAFINYLGLMTWQMMAIGWVAILFKGVRASLYRINKILVILYDLVGSL